MSRYHDDRTAADLPGRLPLSESKLRIFHPELFGWRAWLTVTWWNGVVFNSSATIELIAEHLVFGDSNPAIVVSIAPELIIGAYSDDLDAIVLLRFDPTWVERLHLVVGMRVLTINTYMRGSRVSPDVEEGARSARRWVNVYPLIAETLCDDSLLVQKRKAEIDAELWGRAEDLVAEMTRRDRVHLRDGSPLGARKRGILSPFPRG
ncbi:MAG TPA: hypothetical protein VF407_06220 [Polyangiaceae bacterium]